MSPRPTPAEVDEVLAFWFDELEPKDWFVGSAELDVTIRDRFGDLLEALRRDGAAGVGDDPRAMVAAVIVLDQFSRNVHRGTADAFAADAAALSLARRAIGEGADGRLDVRLRYFLYMPFMHSEDLADQQTAVRLYGGLPGGDGTKWATEHLRVVERFGRFPHRNAVLGRADTPAERQYLETAARYGQ